MGLNEKIYKKKTKIKKEKKNEEKEKNYAAEILTSAQLNAFSCWVMFS